MSDVDSFSRQWLLLRLLCRKNAQISLRELAVEFAVSTKTISRDLETLRGVGFPIQEEIGYRGRKTWSCNTESIVAGLTLTFEEATALYLGRRFLEPLAGTIFWDASQSALKKIRAGFGNKTLKYLEKLSTMVHLSHVGLSDYSQRSEILDVLMVSLEDSRPTRLLYKSAQSETAAEAVVHPHGIAYHRASLYLVAYVPNYNELRHYKVDRIRDAEHITGERFTRIEGFDLREHFADSFGVFHRNGTPYSIRIRFAPEVSRYVEEHSWHTSQKLTRDKDGTIVLELKLSSLEETKAWVLSFGAKAQVEEPEELREMIAQDIHSLSLFYSNKEGAVR